MSDFASAIVVLDTPRQAVVKAVAELDLPTWVAPARGARVAIFPDANPERIVRALGVQLPAAVLVTLAVGEGVPVVVGVHRRGSAVLALKLDDHAAPKVADAAVTQLTSVLSLKPAKAAPAKPAKPAKKPEAFRDVLYRLLDLGDLVAGRHFAAVTRGAAETPARFVGFTYVHDTRVRDLTAADLVDDEPEPEPEPEPAPAPAAPPRAGTGTGNSKGKGKGAGKKQVIRLAPAEAAELTQAFLHARTDPSRPAPVAGAEGQLATATNATAWLAVRRTIDPARVAADVMKELVDVIHVGRFASEGERATVVREAAAMLLGRALKAQKATSALVAQLRRDAGPSSGPAEQACWEIVLRMAGLATD
jgi:hypothetical protein